MNNNNETPTPNGIISAKTIRTFEQLLLSDSSMSPASISGPNNSVDSPRVGDANAEKLRSDLTKSKVQLEHLNELLNESELNNARLSEQINLLKDEIRRYEPT